ncbi:MAG TPA: Gfo/Idh/MocA family oxidoreductase [Vicinamibacteria bacterium]
MTQRLSRRQLLQSAAAATAGLGLSRPVAGGQAPVPEPALTTETRLGVPFEARDPVRVGLVGCGGRGLSLLNDLLGVEKVEVKAVCDILPDQAEKAQALCEKRGAKRPEAYTKGELHYEELVKRDDLDVVYIPTPWRWHVRMAVSAMQAGKHVAVEVPAAVTLEECWKLVEVSERTRRHCVMLENCNYGQEEMTINKMVKAGLFGELLHAECAYNHDLREIVFENRSEGLWRRAEHIGRNGNLYPTHGLGPVAWYLGIHQGDRFDHMVSMSSPEAGLTEHRKAKVPAGDPKWSEKYDCGDVNTSLLKTAKGRTIVLQHNIANPRPYDRINLVAGTKGIFRGYPARIFFDGHKGEHKWGNLKEWNKRYEDPLWTKLKKAASKSGHGGMDYVMNWRLMECLRRGLPPDMNVYDAAAWSAPAPLSEMSVAAGSAPVKFPDFTRGRWRA